MTMLTAALLGASVCVGALTGAAGVDLTVRTSAAPEPAVAGGFLTYTIVLTNASSDAATDVEMIELLPEATTYASSALPVAGGSWDCVAPPVGTHGKVSCASKCFGGGASAEFAITVRVESCQGGAPLTSTTIVSSVTDETDPRNNTATARSTVFDPGTCDDGNICTVGDRCAPSPSLTEDFDGVAAPAIPPGWTATLVAGPVIGQPWRTSRSAWDTAPNAAFSPDASDIRDSVLDSPAIPILSSHAQLSFRNYYDLEYKQDGGVLEIRIDEGPFVDILAAGGSFEEGGYDETISENFGNPIHGRQAWTGAVTRFVTTTVNLPASAAGRTIVLRWRLGTDRALGHLGQWIDSVTVSGRDSCRPGPSFPCDDNDPCTSDTCDAVAGCRHVAMSCDDGNPCTDDACGPMLQCVHTNNSAACDDGDACTRTDLCGGGACVGSNAVVCHDADVCTADACDPVLRCVATTANFDTAEFSAGRVDGRDLAVFARAWNSCPGGPRYDVAANLDRQGACIDLTDFHLFMNAFGRACPS